MKKIFSFLFLVIFSSFQFAIGCTTFFLEKNGLKIFGKNYDWVTGTGAVHTNISGKKKFSLPLDNSKIFSWTSRYGSVTFNQYGKEFPNGGMNEKGLVVELMWLDKSEYPQADERPSISVLQWIQYQLDNCVTVDEVLATDKIMRVVSSGTPQHYLVADAAGGIATIEFLQGKLVVHKGKNLPYPVLANDPYQTSVQGLKNSETGRFATACKMIQQYETKKLKEPIIDYGFSILKNVSQGSFTKWNIVYDITNLQIYFKSQSQIKPKVIALKDFTLSKAGKALSFDLNAPGKGKITNQFIPFSQARNKMMLQKTFEESASRFTVPKYLQDAMVRMAAGDSGI